MKSFGQVLLVAGIFALAGCGGGSSSSNQGSIGTGSTDTGSTDTGSTGSGSTGSGSTGTGSTGTGSTGTGSTGTGSTGTGSATDATALRTAAALASGDPSGLQSADATSLLDQAIAEANSRRQTQAAALKSIYGDGTAVSDLSLNIGKSSVSIGVLASTTASPYILSDGGAGIAAVTTYGGGRGMAYGADVLQWMAGTSTQQQHYPQFLRAFTWVLTGNGGGALPATIKYATAGYTASYVKTFIARTGKASAAIDCAIADSSNTCWSGADLLVFGGSVTASSGLTSLVQSYLAAGKAVIYMHPSWGQSAGGTQVLAAMGMTMGGYPGNYFASTANISVSSTRTIAASLTAADQLGAFASSLALLKQSALTLDLASDSSSLTPFKTMLAELGALQTGGVDIFSGDSRYLLHRLLVLWADMQRPTIAYGKVSRSDPVSFLRTYATDAFLWFARSATTTAVAGQGDYMQASAQSLTPNSSWEELDITLPQTSGITLIGRGALPAKGLQIEVLDAAATSSLGIQTSYLRSWGDPLTEAKDTYARPLRPHSFTIPLATGTVNFVTPNGGPLMLNYSGAVAGAVVKLRVKGATRYAHFDYVQGMSDSDVAEAAAALNAGDFGWQTTKVVGGEIQQTMAYAKSVIGTTAPAVYANNQIRDGLFNSNHISNGYNDAGMTTQVSSLCSSLGWTCDGSIHNAPLVQHFVGWIATCGFLCSGNPIDGSAGIGIGWGYAHEMGHNTVQRVMHITPDGTHGCVVECDNNILSSTTALRVYETLGLEISSGHPLDHPGLYAAIVANRATGLTGDALVSDMETRVWSDMNNQNVMRAVHFQLAFLFTKERGGLSKPTMTNTLDFFSLLTKGDRLVNKSFTTATAANYGMGRYATNTITNQDLLYVLSSKIIGKDMRTIFWMYGIPLSADALGSISDLGLAIEPRSFYALPAGKHNQLSTGQWMNIESSTPAWPY